MYPSHKKAVFVRSNLIDRDPWLAREIETVKQNGYSITLICWDRDCQDNSPQWTPGDDYREIRLRLRAPWGARVLPLMMLWWCFAFFWLMAVRGNMVHAVNLDSGIPAVIAGKLRRRRVVYEIFDVYADLMMWPQLVRNIGVGIEKIVIRLADAVVLSNEAQKKELKGVPNRNVAVIYNTPPDTFSPFLARANDRYTLFYAGVLYRSRPLNLDKVMRIVNNMNGIKLVVAGYGDLAEEIARSARASEGKIEFIGKISHAEVLQRTAESDLLFALYSPQVVAVKHASCNKLFEAMMCQKPIIVCKGTAMAELVESEGCGLVVDPSNEAEIREAIVRLREDPGLSGRLAANGRRAFKEKFDRRIMEERLLALYHAVEQKR